MKSIDLFPICLPFVPVPWHTPSALQTLTRRKTVRDNVLSGVIRHVPVRHGANVCDWFPVFNTKSQHRKWQSIANRKRIKRRASSARAALPLLTSVSRVLSAICNPRDSMLRSPLLHAARPFNIIRPSIVMGKKKAKGEYNDFLEDTRYKTTNAVHTTLQSTSTLSRTVSPPASSQPRTTTPPYPPGPPPPRRRPGPPARRCQNSPSRAPASRAPRRPPAPHAGRDEPLAPPARRRHRAP